MDIWDIGFSPYTIFDGVYPNFSRGQIAKFAVEFWPYSLAPSSEAVIRAERSTRREYRSNNVYDVNAKVEYAAEWDEVFYAAAPGTMDGLPMWDAQGEPIFYHPKLVRQTRPEPVCVLDCGIRTYCKGRGRNLPTKSGEFVNATIQMSIDQFFYSAFPPTAHDMPPVIYTWRIEEITLFTAPQIEKRDEVGRLRREFDMERVTSQNIEQMDAHKDRHWYTVRCTKLDIPPVHMNRKEMQAYYAQDKIGKRYQ